MRRVIPYEARGTVLSIIIALLFFACSGIAPSLCSAQAQGAKDSKAPLPKFVGEPGSVRVTPSYGMVTDTLPIEVPPGRRNVHPRLSLTYSSMGALGDTGLGWRIGIGRVERWRGDGTPTVGEPGGFSYVLSGAGGELRDTGGGVYRARIENVYREFRRAGDGWEMPDGQGVLHRFGGTPESRIDGQLWMLDRVQDPSGNTINYSYEKVNGALYPKEIRYTGYAPSGDPGSNRLEFEYEDRSDWRVSYGHLVREERTLRLKSISVYAGDSFVRRYEFAYEQDPLNEQSLLARVDMAGADETSVITLRTLEYGSRSLSWYPSGTQLPFDLADDEGRDTGARVIDINGDTYADIVGNGSEVYLGDGSGLFTKDQTWSASLAAAGVQFVATGKKQGGDLGVRLLDVNMDGRPDLFIAHPNRREVWLNTGSGWLYDEQWTQSLESLTSQAEAWADSYFLNQPTNCSPPHCGGELGDFPGCTDPDAEHPPDCDPETDENCLPPHCSGSQYCGPFTPGCEEILEPFSLVESDFDSKGVQITDVNGDGRPDIVWSMRRTDSLYWIVSILRVPVSVRGVFLNTGAGWEKNDTLTASLWSIPAFVDDSQLQGYDMQDVNGDGLADIVRTLSSAPREVLLNTGNGWIRDESYSSSLADNSEIISLNGDRKGQGLIPTDFNDDGLVDYLRANVSVTKAYRNTGTGWEESPYVTEWLSSNGIAFSTEDGKSTGVVLADINGDGLSDFVDGSGDHMLWVAAGQVRSGLLVRATSALGEVTNIEWASSSEFDNRRVDGVEGLPMPLPVAASVSHRPGREDVAFTTTYAYGGGLFEGRQFRGFAWCERSKPGGLTVLTRFHQEEELAGALDVEEGYDSEGRLRTRSYSLYDTVEATPPVKQVRLLQHDEERIDPGGVRHSQVINGFDDRLNYVWVWRDPDIDVSGDESTTLLTWARDEEAGVWSLPDSISILGANGVLSESIMHYNDQWLPSESQDLVDGGAYVSKFMEYDQYGNLIRLVDRTGNVTEFEYGDPTATYRTQAVDPEGRVLMSEYDPRFGELIRDVDAGGNVTTKEYDAFGRLKKVTLPGDESSPFGTKTYTYSPLGNAEEQFYSVAETETPGEPDTLETKRFFDGVGLIYRAERDGPQGRKIITLTEFDDAGNPLSTSRPFFEGDEPPMSVITRDELHRPVRALEPDGIELTLSYAGARVDVVDKRGFMTYFYRNADGKVTGVHQWVDGVEQVTSYAYDALGRLTRIVDALGSETRIVYDALGRRVRLEDPNAGTYEYYYDGEGRLIAQTAPDDQTTAFQYNRAGDLIRKEFPDGAVTKFTYGEPGQRNAAGRIVRIEDAAGVVKIKYDARGNVVERRRKVLGRTYVTGYAYDSLGRVRRTTYPDGFTVFYDYDSGGNLARVTDGDSRVVAVQTGYNAAGQVGEIGFGNNVRSRFLYDELLRMNSIDTFSAAGDRLQDFQYAYDPEGNIQSITDAAFGASQTFEYDSVGRLVRARGPYGEELYEYDAIGNLLRKGDLVFAVDPIHPQRVTCGVDLGLGQGNAKGIGNNPHAVTCEDLISASELPLKKGKKAIRSGGTQKNVARSFKISYDERGNVIQKGGRRFEYDPENHLLRIREANGRLIERNVYDAGGQRIIQRTPRGTTIFIDGIYEEGKTHVSRHVRAGNLLIATVVTPRAGVKLIKNAPYAGLGASRDMAGRLRPLLVGFIGFGILAVMLAPFSGGARRRCLLGLSAVGEAVRRDPWKTVVALVLVPAIINATTPQTLFAKPSPGQPKSEKRYYYHSNHLGSVNVVTDDRGKVVERRDYKPYGDQFNWTGPNSGPRELLLTFDSHRYDDATGLYYFGARHYDPQLGRFLTADTEVPDPMNPKSLHRYAFGGGNPIRYVDPTGHAWYDWLIGIFVILVAVVLAVVTFGALAPVSLLLAAGAALAFLGAAAFASWALAKGLSPLSADFWVATAAGFVLGAAIGAGIAALPTAIGGGFLASIAASALVGAVFGAIETTIVFFVNGGGPEGLLGALFSVDALIGAAIGAGLGLITGLGFGIMGAAVAKTAVTTVKVIAAVVTVLSIWPFFYAGFTGRSFAEAFWFPIPFFGIFMASPPKSIGVPAWALGGTWFGLSGDPAARETAPKLKTMPLAT
jgi:RHS repeat-associated protein